MVHDGNEGEPLGTYLVERYLPGFTESELRAAWARVRDAAEAMSADGSPIAHLSSAFIQAEESVFCLFEARSAQAVQAVSESARFPFDRIAEVLLLRARRAGQQTGPLPDGCGP
jgi:hypothetical protein